MTDFANSMNRYQQLLDEGHIRVAYRGLMKYLVSLKTELKKRHPEYYVSSSVYAGYMDMSYFSFTPETIKKKKLEIAILFNHENFHFEAWLVGVNKKVQADYLKLFQERGWNKDTVEPAEKGIEAIATVTLVDEPNFNDLEHLTDQIEKQSLSFIADVGLLLAKL